MKQLNKFQSILFFIGALFMLCGAILFITRWYLSPYMYVFGAVIYAGMQLIQRYEGKELAIRRLRRIQIISLIFILLAGILMILNYQYIYMKWFNYGIYIRNEWVVSLLIGAVLQLYISFRLPAEIKKEAKKR